MVEPISFSGTTGGGMVVRNAHGELVDGIRVEVEADCALVTEPIVVREGIKLAVEQKFQKVVVEMDSSMVHFEIVEERRVKN